MPGGSPIAAQHMARPDLARRAGRAGADHHAVEIERDDLRLGGDAGQGERGRVGQARRGGADHQRLRHRASAAVSSAIAQPARRGRIRRGRPGGLGGGGETGDAGQVLGAGAAAALLPAAARAAAIGSAPPATTSAPIPGGPPSLCADRLTRSAPSAAASSGDLAGGLHRVAMEQRAVRVRDRGDLARPAARSPVSLLASITETSAGRGSAASMRVERREIDDAVRVDRDALGLGRGLQHRIMLDRRDEDAPRGRRRAAPDDWPRCRR